MANDRWDDDDDRRRYNSDEEYERNFWQDRESRRRRGMGDDPRQRYSGLPVMGVDYGGGRRSPADWQRSDERDRGGYRERAGAQNWEGQGGERGWWERTKDEVRSWMGDEGAEHRREADHRGRGPRSYTRSDERIREEISDRLMEDRYVDATEIDITVTTGEVTLAGLVDSRDTRRRAENLAADVLGVKDVQNNLRVSSSSSYGAGTGAALGTASGASSGARSGLPPATSGATSNADVSGRTSSTTPRH